MMIQTFRAICPNSKTLQRFELVSDHGKTVGWCPHCRTLWPLSELSDGMTEAEAIKEQAARDAARKAKNKKKP